MTPKTRNLIRLVVVLLLVAASLIYVRWNTDRLRHAPLERQATCLNNLTQIALAFRAWSLDNQNQFPFNVGTNTGGSLQFCARGSDGFDTNAALHFQVMSNDLNTPRLLVCPQDKGRNAAVGFRDLRAENITYRLRTGTNISAAHPKEVLMVCPIDGNTLYCDGTVVGRATAGDKNANGSMRIPPP